MICYYGHFPFNGETGQTRISSPCINGKIWFKLLEIRKSSENGSPSKLIQTFGLDWPEVQTFCVPFNNLTVLTRLAVLMESALWPASPLQKSNMRPCDSSATL
jgi:hypothetical protein